MVLLASCTQDLSKWPLGFTYISWDMSKNKDDPSQLAADSKTIALKFFDNEYLQGHFLFSIGHNPPVAN